MSKLYHYTTAQGLVGMIESKKIHCTNSMFMNDPSERIYFDKVLKSVLKDKQCKEIYDFCVFENFPDARVPLKIFSNSFSFFLFSFIEDRDSLTMWRHYSKTNGCCIEFEDNDIINIGNNINCHIDSLKCGSKIIDVKYEKKEQIDILRDIILSWGKKISLEAILENIPFVLEYMQEIGRCRVSFKDSAYKDEKEKRLVVGMSEVDITKERNHLKKLYEFSIKEVSGFNERYKTFEDCYKDTNQRRNIKYKTSESGVVVEYLEVDFNPKIAIKSVLLHPSSSEIQKKGVERMLKTKEINAKVSISKKPFRVM